MKKIICVLLTIFLCLCFLVGCGEKAAKENNKITIVATVFPPYDFARAIAGDKAEISMLIRPGSESHTFEPTPTDMKRAEECDIFICLGGESESWAQRLIESSENKERVTVVLNNTVTLLEAASGQEHNHNENHIHSHKYDEHIWTSPVNAVNMSQAIYTALCDKDPDNAEYYKENFEAFKKELMALDEDFKNTVQEGNKKEIFFGDRFPFLYLTHRYSLGYHAAFPGCAEQTEPDVNTLIDLIRHIKSENIDTVFYTEFSSQKVADMLCSETGAKKALLHSCHNVTKEELESGETYITLMRDNLENLKKALN